MDPDLCDNHMLRIVTPEKWRLLYGFKPVGRSFGDSWKFSPSLRKLVEIVKAHDGGALLLQGQRPVVDIDQQKSGNGELTWVVLAVRDVFLMMICSRCLFHGHCRCFITTLMWWCDALNQLFVLVEDVLHKMYMMFCCSSCVSNVKEDDLMKGRLIESRHGIPLTCSCMWLIFCGIPCGVDSCCLLWILWSVNGGCCARKMVVEVRIVQPKHDVYTKKVVEFSAEPFCSTHRIHRTIV